jgi:hypothetical protein
MPTKHAAITASHGASNRSDARPPVILTNPRIITVYRHAEEKRVELHSVPKMSDRHPAATSRANPGTEVTKYVGVYCRAKVKSRGQLTIHKAPNIAHGSLTIHLCT